MTDIVKDKIESLGFHQLIQGPTRFWPHTPDYLIDQVWTNAPEMVTSSRNILHIVADHNVIELCIRMKGKQYHPRETIKRKRTNFDLLRYIDKISKINWEPMYSQTDLNLAYTYFEDNVLQILESEAPMTKVQISNKHKNWISPQTRSLISDRNTAREQARLQDSDILWQHYKI